MSLSLKNVSLHVGADTHIYPTDLNLAEGEFNILLGTTLAGKTTLLRLMAGLEKPSSGQIMVDDTDVTGESVQKRNVAMVYQQFINYPNFSVYDNIASPMRLQRKSKQEIDAAIQEVAELLKLTSMLKRNPSELSGGQQQRTALARALVKKAKLVLLDEPLANLDYKLREELREELPKLFRDSGATVVYATTEPSEALLLGGHTAAMHEGKVIQFGKTAQVYREPINQISASVFSDPPMNLITASKANMQLALTGGVTLAADGALSKMADGDYLFGIRPHHVNLNPAVGDAKKVEAKVLLAEISGSESTVHAQVGDDIWISVNHGIHVLEKGQSIDLFLNTSHGLFFDSNGVVVG